MPIQIDMEMPRSCGDCRFCTNYRQMDCARCHAVGDYGGREIPEWSTSELYAGRQEWCPLKETPTWHVVAEGDLPEDDREVLITYKSNIDGELNVDISVYCEATFGGRSLEYKEWGSPFPYFHVDNEVLAWRELPEPWEGANKQCENG